MEPEAPFIDLTGRTRERATELLELHDALDRLDEELRVQRIAFVLTPLLSILLFAPLFLILFINEAPCFAAYPGTFILILGTILYSLTVERRRHEREREAIRSRIGRLVPPRICA